MIRTVRLLVIAVLLSTLGTPSVAGPEKAGGSKQGPWRVAPNDFIHYRVDVKRFGDGADNDVQLPDPIRTTFGVFGYEIEDDERPLRPFHDEAWVILPYTLWMPRTLTRMGRSIRIDDDFGDYGQSHSRIRGRGKLTVSDVRKEGNVHDVDVTGLVVFETEPAAAYARDDMDQKGNGRLQWQATFDLARGVMRRATFSLSLDRARMGMYPNGTRPSGADRMTFEGTLEFERHHVYRYAGFRRDVGEAIDRGLKAVRALRDKDGVWAARNHHPMGETSLGLLTLIKGGWDRSDDDLQKVVEWLTARDPEGTYSVGLALSAIEAWRAPDRELGHGEGKAADKHGTRVLTKSERAFVEAMATYLIDHGQTGTNPPRRTGQPEPPGRKKRGRKKPGRRKAGPATGVSEYIRWGYPDSHSGVQLVGPGAADAIEHWDNSNSQYAVLGLHSASLCDVAVPRHIWFKVLGHFLRHQRADGPARPDFELRGADESATRYETSSRYATDTRSRGWGYGHMDGDEERKYTSAYGSMTCAGISSLAIADGALVRRGVARYGKAEQRGVREAIRDGFAFLDANWAAFENPAQGHHHYLYYLYGLERAAMLTGVKWIGSHDWYWEGAMHLILSQQTNGRWNGGLVDTAFAVLFLKRGTKPVITPR